LNSKKLIFGFIAFIIGLSSFAQSARVKGVILDQNNQPIANVNVFCFGSTAQSNANGFYLLNIPEDQNLTVTFTHVSFKKATVSLILKTNEELEFNLVMNNQQEQMGEIIVTTNNKKRIQGITSIAPDVIRKIPGANAGIENSLKTLPGVNSNNE
jgi:hypothetical protein